MDDITGTVLENRKILTNIYTISITLQKPCGTIVPGQFVMLQIPRKEIFLRRPFSIYDYRNHVLFLMYKVVGKGTEALCTLRKGEGVKVLGPLGKGFRNNGRKNAILVAGGIGIAGIHLLAKSFNRQVPLLFGCENKKEIALLGNLAKDQNTYIATLDGTYGYTGTVVDLLKHHVISAPHKKVAVYACGPEAMYRALKEVMSPQRVSCQVLVEERMACGLGLCFGCVKKTTDEKEPYKRVCMEGPVFDLWKISL